ncbi:hypothetical protein GN330_16630 [Nitratireductor sp. CAU 1489]|uniref:Uncharacterized protein n=1 Tax=Nitratireductor arenosus TaxID=2682096 RepID=A0A844QHW0_9HYPH|nr:hypothetical protein [Nitratireductor arenosus]MVA98875.1 hypothetical protein [Nitratireductor arenosus]
MRPTYVYLVWNKSRSECVGFDEKADAIWTSKGCYPRGHNAFGTPTIGEVFRDCYAKEGGELFMQKVKVS